MAERTIKVDMSEVVTFVRASEGVHVAKLASIVEKTSQEGNPMLTATFEITKGESKGAKVFENFPLSQNALWKLKNLLEAIGMKSEGKLKIDLDAMEGKVCDITVAHEDYRGQTKARITDFKRTAAKAVPKPAPQQQDDEADDDGYDDDDE